jgi:protein-L-isoaspartate(D-aspartate) O-methyltransferase
MLKICFTILIILTSLHVSGQSDSEGYKILRDRMVREQIERRSIRQPATINAMKTVERHLFVSEADRKYAYGDHPLPIGYGQTISQPYIVAFMTQVIDPKVNQRVLEIGTGSGYQAAVLCEIVDSVFTVEIVGALYELSTNRLEDLGYNNVITKHGDGYFGWPEKGPFDAIVVTAAAEFIPPPLTEQLKPGGKMIIPVGSPFLVQQLILVEKSGSKLKTRKLMPVKFVPFTRSPED